MSDDHSITPDERAMLGEDVDQPEEQPPVKATTAATGTPAKDLVAAAAAAAAEAAEADDDFEKAKQEIDGMGDPDEDEKLDGLQQIISASTNAAAAAAVAPTTASSEPTKSPDETSVYVGQVDYDATPDELQSHFEACGTINRVTILCDKFSGRPKGYAYIEFQDKDGAENALSLEGSPFKGRTLKVVPKRTNVPGLNTRGRGRGRGRGPNAFYMVPTYRGRGRGRGGYRGGHRGGYRGGYYNGYY